MEKFVVRGSVESLIAVMTAGKLYIRNIIVIIIVNDKVIDERR